MLGLALNIFLAIASAHCVAYDAIFQDYTYYNVGVLMAGHLDSPFDLVRCGPAVDIALEEINDKFLKPHKVILQKVQASYPSCSGALAPGYAADMHFKDNVIAFIGPACTFALEPVASLAAYWNTPIITGMGDQPPSSEEEVTVTSGILGRLQRWNRNDTTVSVITLSLLVSPRLNVSLIGYCHKVKMISLQSQGIFKNKSKFYPTLTRMSYCQCRLKLVFGSIFKQFGWKHIALIFDRSDLFSLTVGKNLEYGLKQDGLLAFVRELDGNDEESYDNYLRDASMYARIVILSVRGVLVRKFMLAAHELGMTRGDWAFLDVEIFKGKYWTDHDWENGDRQDATARKAYEALLRVSLLQPTDDEFQDFADKVKTRALNDYNYSMSEGEEVNFVSGAFYDGVYLLGMALNETINETITELLGEHLDQHPLAELSPRDVDKVMRQKGLNKTLSERIRDGFRITKKMWNRQFKGITGHVRIDDNGDRDADYSVLDLDPITGKFEVVAHYYGLHKKYSPFQGKKIHWPGGREGPPPDVPKCGFLGNNPDCRNDDSYVMILYGSFAFGAFMVLTATLACISYKHMRHVADLNNMSWRIKPEEVLLEVGKPYGSKLGLQKLTETFGLRSGRASITSCNSLPPTHIFTTIGIYKGTRVAIKKITKKKVDVNKKLLWEIKQVRDVTHENTVRFLGACIECPTVLIITEYCPKGSLRDVLQNDAIQLDWNFRMSLIHDVVKGMSFLHGSEVSVHGKLRSCNCLIDGRFVLKISDFGLTTLTTPNEIVKDQAYQMKLLWIAPELLPLTVVPGTPATQKGDVYSFALILEEIILRAGPFHAALQYLEVQEILSRVAAREFPPFRPMVNIRDCPDDLLELMERCWLDNPDERPTFEVVRGVLKCIMKGYCENLMDDLLRRMEQYANNLESLVGEKTEQLSQEKRRSEELLYQVLPRPVACQLMAGEIVQPEQFECVTIYFSDIVGFTALCAKSSPMQVVDFLNDLYSTFDRIIGFYDVYKVETIGDAYMVVSGLPERNGNDHAREIALMSLAILKAVQSFVIKHQPEYKLKLRIGIHSGPVCAGIVGQKMPHFCLFGDTVNTASRMESSGLPLKIHLSETTKKILEKFGTFNLELRGEVELKGKGLFTTYWLLESTEPDPRPPTPCHNTQEDVNPYPLVFMG